jgi:glutathione peroxidase
LFKLLKSEKKGVLGIGTIPWNFTKFLIDRHGNVVARFATRDAPEKIERRILEVLSSKF